jgi:hypothetical protein
MGMACPVPSRLLQDDGFFASKAAFREEDQLEVHRGIDATHFIKKACVSQLKTGM